MNREDKDLIAESIVAALKIAQFEAFEKNVRPRHTGENVEFTEVKAWMATVIVATYAGLEISHTVDLGGKDKEQIEKEVIQVKKELEEKIQKIYYALVKLPAGWRVE